ncbi:ADP-ribose pyrophosphatase [Arcticibacter svalbardensis MN12-7]|uniref:GDP-mannose pyrophosphatase n=1 Tax=Arcticibacter svalbardensis MN12-7 TaxID=1150600 RepID=R9GNS5_9SPHI|nr:NUDIX hydrolase [Arcticibacter svalbardensis]EOR93155.1 ADP-ribose pyrophosphatase [Arcticibacter svalbardensis MN12-7]
MINEDTNPWKILSQDDIYTNPWINVTEYKVLNPSGGNGIYGKVHFKNFALGIIALDEDLHIWLVGQFRFALNQYSWEIPEGGGPLGINPLESAKRELLEETGLTASNWSELQHIHLSNSVSDEFGIIYLARGLQPGQAEPEETEELQLKRIPFEQAYQMVLDNEITDSMSIAAILKVKILMLENKLA